MKFISTSDFAFSGREGRVVFEVGGGNEPRNKERAEREESELAIKAISGQLESLDTEVNKLTMQEEVEILRKLVINENILDDKETSSNNLFEKIGSLIGETTEEKKVEIINKISNKALLKFFTTYSEDAFTLFTDDLGDEYRVNLFGKEFLEKNVRLLQLLRFNQKFIEIGGVYYRRTLKGYMPFHPPKTKDIDKRAKIETGTKIRLLDESDIKEYAAESYAKSEYSKLDTEEGAKKFEIDEFNRRHNYQMYQEAKAMVLDIRNILKESSKLDDDKKVAFDALLKQFLGVLDDSYEVNHKLRPEEFTQKININQKEHFKGIEVGNDLKEKLANFLGEHSEVLKKENDVFLKKNKQEILKLLKISDRKALDKVLEKRLIDEHALEGKLLGELLALSPLGLKANRDDLVILLRQRSELLVKRSVNKQVVINLRFMKKIEELKEQEVEQVKQRENLKEKVVLLETKNKEFLGQKSVLLEKLKSQMGIALDSDMSLDEIEKRVKILRDASDVSPTAGEDIGISHTFMGAYKSKIFSNASDVYQALDRAKELVTEINTIEREIINIEKEITVVEVKITGLKEGIISLRKEQKDFNLKLVQQRTVLQSRVKVFKEIEAMSSEEKEKFWADVEGYYHETIAAKAYAESNPNVNISSDEAREAIQTAVDIQKRMPNFTIKEFNEEGFPIYEVGEPAQEVVVDTNKNEMYTNNTEKGETMSAYQRCPLDAKYVPAVQVFGAILDASFWTTDYGASGSTRKMGKDKLQNILAEIYSLGNVRELTENEINGWRNMALELRGRGKSIDYFWKVMGVTYDDNQGIIDESGSKIRQKVKNTVEASRNNNFDWLDKYEKAKENKDKIG